MNLDHSLLDGATYNVDVLVCLFKFILIQATLFSWELQEELVFHPLWSQVGTLRRPLRQEEPGFQVWGHFYEGTK